MSGKVCGPAAAVKTQTPNYTPGPGESPQMCVEKAKPSTTPDTKSQDKAQAAVGRAPSKKAPTEEERVNVPKGTVKAGELARDKGSVNERNGVGTAVATGVALNGAAGPFQRNAYKHARTVASQHTKTAGQLRTMNRKIGKLENAVKNGAGKKAQRQLQVAKKQYEAAKKVWEADKSLVRSANEFMRNNPGLKSGGPVTKTTRGAQKFHRALQTSRLGQRVLSGARVLTSPKVTRGLTIVSGALEGVSGYLNSSNRTTEGKVLNGTLNALGSVAVTANPVGAVADLVLPQGYRPSDITRAGGTAASAIVEGAVTRDERAAADFQKRSEKGEFGPMMKTLSKSGAYWADKGVGKTVKDFGKEVGGLFRKIF